MVEGGGPIESVFAVTRFCYKMFTVNYISFHTFMSSPSLTPTASAPRNSPIIQGWLYKLTWFNLHRSWQRRYFVLDDCELRYYKQQNDPRPIGTVDLRLYSDVGPYPSKHSPFTFRIDSECNHHRAFLLHAETKSELEHWMAALVSSIHPAGHSSCIYDIESDTGSVLDKWLERLDLQDDDPKSPTTSSSTNTRSSSWTFQSPALSRSMTTTASFAEDDDDDGDNDHNDVKVPGSLAYTRLQRRVTMPEQYTINHDDDLILLPSQQPPPSSPLPPTPPSMSVSPRSI
ncbi:hypothetical protein BX666DRAFT_2006612 [Dichotomocladium elegans]|nr:hypothetical protein BX666DRAFT_2006612 [Dichotomocladium elegans]